MSHIEEVHQWQDAGNGRQKSVCVRSFGVTWYPNGTRSYQNLQTGERATLFVRLTLLSKPSDEHKRVRVQGFLNGRLESSEEWNIDKLRGEHYGPLSGYLSSQREAIALSFDHLQSRVMYPETLDNTETLRLSYK